MGGTVVFVRPRGQELLAWWRLRFGSNVSCLESFTSVTPSIFLSATPLNLTRLESPKFSWDYFPREAILPQTYIIIMDP